MKQTKQVELLYQIAKITAENDSIFEGYLYCDKYSREDFEQDIKLGGFSHYSQAVEIANLLVKAQQEAQNNTAMQCYLECLAVECGEGECSRAIVTKFGLEVHND